MICSDCKEPCDEVTRDDGFSYDYGSITNAYHSQQYESSDCCDAPACEGNSHTTRTIHKARKDHFHHTTGKLLVSKGKRYIKWYTVGWFINDQGVSQGIKQITKREMTPCT